MGETSSDFRDTLLEVIEASHEPGVHPSPDRWLAYQRGELAAEEMARLQEHLARCRDCFDLAAGAAEFARPEADAGTGEAMETEALWRLIRPRLDLPPSNVRSLRPPSGRFRLPTLRAASFFVVMVGMGLLLVYQQSELKARRSPRANVPIFEIDAGERFITKQEQLIPTGAAGMLVFHPAEDLPAYRLVIRENATGKELSSHELRPDRNLAFNLYLPEGLPPGRYRLELLDGAGKVRETHILRVTGD